MRTLDVINRYAGGSMNYILVHSHYRNLSPGSFTATHLFPRKAMQTYSRIIDGASLNELSTMVPAIK